MPPLLRNIVNKYTMRLRVHTDGLEDPCADEGANFTYGVTRIFRRCFVSVRIYLPTAAANP